MRLGITGSRTCPPIDKASFLPFVPDMIVSGGAKGADTYAKEYALKNNIPILEFLPDDWKYERKVPLMRNIQIVDNGDFLHAIWDSKSRDTKFANDYAQRKGIPLIVRKY